MAKRTTEILVARQSGVVILDGVRYQIHRGRTTAHANHPIVRGREQMWRALTIDYAVDEAKAEAPKKKAEKKPEPEKVEVKEPEKDKPKVAGLTTDSFKK